jgi:hypothetical protein
MSRLRAIDFAYLLHSFASVMFYSALAVIRVRMFYEQSETLAYS